MDLTNARADPGRGLDLRQLRIDEDTHPDALPVEPLHRLAQLRFLGAHVETSFGGDLVATLGTNIASSGLSLAAMSTISQSPPFPG
jgi:hypothetical protein